MGEFPKVGMVHSRSVEASVATSGAFGAARQQCPPAELSLRRAAEMLETAAYDLAGRESPVLVSRLIEMAAEVDRLSRSLARQVDDMGANIVTLRRD